MTTTGESIQIENVVASTAISQELDLEALATDLGPTKYDPENLPGLIYQLEEPDATGLLFRSGKVVCTGASSIDNVQTALEKLFDELRALGIDIDPSPDIEVQNIVSSADLGQPLNLNAIAIGVGLEAVEYEPEQFPGLVYRLDDPGVVVLVFGSGKLIITGGKARADAFRALEVIESRLADLGLFN